ncbi:hypothetical protein ILUMI_16110 [Ignelater luminosus]|uniref:Uncharacterized protein n=1 Tax=Ignelater luminosus TaxID=2038154 RepID=A0A8K0CMD1_IGNLU|nr:hypothetical protein ILUMI_16110 [Ignelater luminosus]
MSDLKLEHRSVVKCLSKEGSGPKNIHEKAQSTNKAFNAFLSSSHHLTHILSICRHCFHLWRLCGRAHRFCGRPLEARTEEAVNKVEDLVLTGRRVKVSVIAREIGISEASAFKILHEDLGMSKVSA